MDYSKTEKRALRQLVSDAYRRELSRALKILSQAFRDWESGAIDCLELNERIHRYHQEDARAIWSRYNSRPSTLLVAAGVHSGVLTMEEIPAAFRERVLAALETFSEVAPPSSKPGSEAH